MPSQIPGELLESVYLLNREGIETERKLSPEVPWNPDLVAQSVSLPIALYLRVYGLHLGALSLSFRLPSDTLLLDPWAY